MTQLVCPSLSCSCSPILSCFLFGSFVVNIGRAPHRAELLRLTAHPAGQPQAEPIGTRLWARPSSRPRRDEKRIPFSALHPPAQTRLCAPAPRWRTAKRGTFSYFEYTRGSIALFRQRFNLIPAQILSEQSIKYGQKHRRANACETGVRFSPFCPCLK